MKQFSHDGVTLAYLDEGAGPPVVLVHGFPFDHAMWDRQVAALAAEYRVLAPDLRGFGGSTLAAADVERGVAMETYAADVAALLDDAGVTDRVVLAGFSMGGYVAWQFARQHGNRLRALVLCDTRAAADTDEAAAGRHAMAADVLAAGNSGPAEVMVPKLVAPRTLEFGGPVVARVMEMIGEASPEGIAAAQRGMAERPDVRVQLGDIACPALVVGGAEDAISPPVEMQDIATALPGGRFVEIPTAGHMTPLENPTAFNAALTTFLRELG